MFSVGTTVKLHGKTIATVTSVHKKGKRLGVVLADGKATFVGANAAAAVA